MKIVSAMAAPKKKLNKTMIKHKIKVAHNARQSNKKMR
ncbi:unnamed protein product [Amoebophrya sp. A25]|nr:unnamed protein product [Amoebophrya sp. A25]|eukprot:GSA25T00027036001.1